MKVKSLEIFKKIIVYGGLLILSFHFLFIIVYLTDGKYSPEILNRATARYVQPLFHQSWKIFAPEPPLWNVRLVYRCQFTDSTWSKWKDPGCHWLLKHYSNRFSYYGKAYLVHAKIARELFNAATRIIPAENLLSGHAEKKELLKITETREYALAEKYLRTVSMENYPEQGISRIQFAYIADHTVVFEERKNPGAEKRYSAVKFPEIILQIE
jgi:hypothetical protein